MEADSINKKLPVFCGYSENIFLSSSALLTDVDSLFIWLEFQHLEPFWGNFLGVLSINIKFCFILEVKVNKIFIGTPTEEPEGH